MKDLLIIYFVLPHIATLYFIRHLVILIDYIFCPTTYSDFIIYPTFGHIIIKTRNTCLQQPLAFNKILPDLYESAGFSRKTSHCLRVTCATRLFQSNVEDKLIRERTGHRLNALLAYEKESHQQNIKVSKILGPPEQNKNVEEKDDVEDLFFDFDVYNVIRKQHRSYI